MKLYKYKNITEDWINKNILFVRDKIVFSKEEQDMLRKCIKQYGEHIYKELFDKVNIKYDFLDVKTLSYTVNENCLNLIDLSSGESVLLYSLICKLLNYPIILISALERLDRAHRNIFFKELYDYDKITVVIMSITALSNDIVDINLEEVL